MLRGVESLQASIVWDVNGLGRLKHDGAHPGVTIGQLGPPHIPSEIPQTHEGKRPPAQLRLPGKVDEVTRDF